MPSVYFNLNSQSVELNLPDSAAANCAKSFVTREGVEGVAGGYVVPEVGLPWLEWIKQ